MSTERGRKQEYNRRIEELLRQGAEGDGTTLTADQCATLLRAMEKRYNDGWKAGAESAESDAAGEGW